MNAQPFNAPSSVPAKPYFGAYPAAGENFISRNVRYIFAAIRRHLWLALGVFVACVALSFVLTMLATPRFTAVSTVQINDQRDEVLGEELETNFAAVSDWDVDRFLNTQLDVLQSEGLAERVANALSLYDDPRFYAAMGSEMPEGAARSTGVVDPVIRGTVIPLLQDGLEVDLPASTRIARIGFTSLDAEMSARIANAFAEEFIQANLQRSYNSSAYARNFVADQLDEARANLEQSENDLNDYAKSAGLIRTRDALATDPRAAAAGTVTASSLLQINDAAIRAQADRIAAEARWQAVRNAPLLSSQPVLASPTVQALMTRQSNVEAELQTARGRYLPDHPTIGRLETELAAVTSQTDEAARNVVNSIRSDYSAAVTAESELNGQVARLRGETLAEQDRSVRYNTLAREADTARSIYEGLLQRFRELNASAGIASSNIAIIDRATIPGARSSPSLTTNLSLGLLFGLFLAGGIVFVRDQMDDVVHVPEDIESKLEMPLLGVIPRSERENPLEELADFKSPVAEAHNSMRGALLYSTREGLPKLMAVTSAQAGEGKSTTSVAMAVGFARMGMRTLLIDADLRRPSLHRLAGLANVRGLTDLLTSREPIASAIVTAPEHGFDLVTSGPIPPSPSELLSSPRMAQILNLAGEEYDVVILDSPPVLGLADAPMLSALVDGTIFVVEADRGRSGQLKTALRRLRAMHPVLIGAVLTKFDPAKAGNRYSAYYGYDYYRYDGDPRPRRRRSAAKDISDGEAEAAARARELVP